MIRRLLVVAGAMLVLSLGTVMTAAIAVPDSRAGMATLAIDTDCTAQAAVTMSPSNINRVSAAHHTMTATLSFPDGLPAGATVSSVVLSLPGGSSVVGPNGGSGPVVFTFSRESILLLVGPQNGDFVFEISGTVGTCTFAAQDTLRITGPIRE